jgi:hypothetical protein
VVAADSTKTPEQSRDEKVARAVVTLVAMFAAVFLIAVCYLVAHGHQ